MEHITKVSSDTYNINQLHTVKTQDLKHLVATK